MAKSKLGKGSLISTLIGQCDPFYTLYTYLKSSPIHLIALLMCLGKWILMGIDGPSKIPMTSLKLCI